MNEDVLAKWADRLAWAATWAGHASNFNKWKYFYCINDLAAEVRALRAERDEIKRKAIEQSEYIQSHGLTEYEMARLKARVAELETQCDRCGLRLAHMRPEHDEMYSATMIITDADTTVQFIHNRANGEVIF